MTRIRAFFDSMRGLGILAGALTVALFIALLGARHDDAKAQTAYPNKVYSLVAANSTNATNIKPGGGTVVVVEVFNNSGTIAYLKLYDKATAPICNSDTPVARYMVPGITGGASTIAVDSRADNFTAGIGFCLVTGIADSDNTAVAASAYIVNIHYR